MRSAPAAAHLIGGIAKFIGRTGAVELKSLFDSGFPSGKYSFENYIKHNCIFLLQKYG